MRRVGEAWTIRTGAGPIVATAIHDGHSVRDDVARLMQLEEAVRLREEDPFTGMLTEIAPTRVVVHSSRFEFDLNRLRDKSVYRTPEEAWGLNVWNGMLPDEVIVRSMQLYDAFYADLATLYRALENRYGRFLVLDLHSYNYRREGPDGQPADPLENPQVNVGTGTMTDRNRWARLIDRFIGELATFDFPGGRLDVRENIRFRGGACAAWTHRTFPESGCVLSVEIKKFFMDEWTGKPNWILLDAIKDALASTFEGILEELRR